MGTVTKPNTFVNGTTANAIEVNSNFDTLYTLVNGNIDNDNVKGAAGIVFSKLDSATVAGVDETQTLTNKTLTTPVITSIYQDAAKTKLMTLPDTASDTLAALDATQSLANKTLPSPVLSGTVTGTYTLGGTPTATSPTITGSPTAAGSTWADLGSVTTADINGGTIDGTPIGGTTPAAVAGTTGTFSGAVTGTTGTFSGAVTAGAVSNVPLLVPGQVQNLSWTKAAGVITIAGADGTALSATNPAWVCVPDATYTTGLHVVLPITSNITILDDDDAGSYLKNMTFGVTSNVAWSTKMPCFIYVVNKDNTSAGLKIGISRKPNHVLLATADIGDLDHAPATPAQTNIYLSGDHFTLSDYDAKPCVCIGATAMFKATTDVDWEFNPSRAYYGIGQHCIDKICSDTYTFPVGQNGATAGKYILDNGGTAPVFTTNDVKYEIFRNGECHYHFYFDGDGGTDGAGAVSTRIFLPYNSDGGGYFLGKGWFSGSVSEQIVLSTAGSAYVAAYRPTIASLTNDLFPNGARTIQGDILYKAF